ncbi:TPA: ribonucleoside-diphosphate reductase subunit alpha [Candidatus Woesearchaeota archaeon]|nr:ribonucleoside-diphosphate reductase subunit alpha [Candidatus Woesearchaeota archaeon]HII68269.1 ribonucleoside-diphosphate reductase subunit alpha [Candidatus Woesearchaeota archaeon]
MEQLLVTKRTGELVDFDRAKIRNAIQKAVKATGSKIQEEQLDRLTENVALEVESRFVDFYPNVENIQDIVEKHLVKDGLYEIAKAYILYRAKRKEEREARKEEDIEKARLGKLAVIKRDKRKVLFDLAKVRQTLERASKGYEEDVNLELVAKEVIKNVYDGVTTPEIEKAMIMAVASFIEHDPAYSYIGARLFLQRLYKEVIGESTSNDGLGISYRQAFIDGIQKAVTAGMADKRLLEFDLESLSCGLQPERDSLFKYIGIQTLYERYFMHVDEHRLELPQSFWMRVAMGLALNEEEKEAKALDFYEVLSSMRFVSSTPTLFHAGLSRPQLSSCYLTTVNDDLAHIFKCLGDNAQLSKWSGGIGNDWTSVRATGSHIHSTNVDSQGVVPFLKIANDVTVAINRSGKRRGATCAYLEAWHLDFEDFLDLRKNTGDDRRRTHDMNTAAWVPDLFMKRVEADEEWAFFSPNETPDLHDLYGREFEKRYEEYEHLAKQGNIKRFKVISAKKLWRKMLTMLFETGHPWITFKDPCNIRSPQDHAGVVHSSNLCTEITLNTSADETAVCNLGSVNLEKHVASGRVQVILLADTVRTAMRMLDNVIDTNYYPTIEAQNSNFRHRPVGLGIMGFQDALFKLDLAFDSPMALEFSDHVMELISYHAILSSAELAKERGAYASFAGSKWDRGLLPFDTLSLLEEARGQKIEVARTQRQDWTPVREAIKQYGMRNSNCMAIAPTATISNIAGCYPCIEPIYKNIYVKSNISGEFTVLNEYLIADLKALQLWNAEMLEQIKYYDGNLQMIPSIPQRLKDKYKEAFEIDPEWAVKLAAVRAKWVDQSQSHNIFLKGTSGKRLSDVYFAAWRSGLKTTYYLRSLGASQIEKSTLDAKKYGYTQKRQYANGAIDGLSDEVAGKTSPAKETVSNGIATEVKACLLNDPTCEACQ